MCCQLPETPSTTKKTVDIQTPQTLGVNLPVVNLARIAKGLSQKKDVSPVVVNCYQRELKYVKDVSCVNQLSFVKPVTNVPAVVLDLPVGARLQNFWRTWEALGAGLKVLKILKQGYILPFWTRLNLARLSTIISCYGNPH